jgi:hypothetical protein
MSHWSNSKSPSPLLRLTWTIAFGVLGGILVVLGLNEPEGSAHEWLLMLGGGVLLSLAAYGLVATLLSL